MKRRVYALLFLFGVTCCTKYSARIERALDSFQLEPGLRIELIAAEPLVVDPVAFAFDADRHLYVVEDRGYPDPAEGGAPTKLGRIARLEDTNNDGRYDRRTEFASGLTYPNGVLPWRGGVFVTCAPDIFYFKDTDGDGVADVRTIVLTGFSDTKTAQIRMSHPTLGLDGWIYVTGGLNGGSITSPAHPDRPAVTYTSADGRFHPETLEFQVTGGRSQFGLTFDAYGRRFGCSNRHPVQHIVMEPAQLQRNPNLLFTATVQDVSKAESEAKVFPVSHASTSADFIPKLIGRSHTGTFTSASGVLIFNGSGLTPAHKGNVFICESAQNLVQRQVVHPDGVTFRSELVHEGREFLASTDEWFRPVFLGHGPGGGLYVADMHRKVIDHPSYVPEEARANLDFESGKSDGRIYRIVCEDFEHEAGDSTKFFSSTPTPQMVAALESPGEWERATAHRLLLERRDPASVPLLKRMAIESDFPESRTRSLWLLNSLGGLDEATLRVALSDREPAVREQAVLLSGTSREVNSELKQKLIATASDSDARVRFSTGIVLGSMRGDDVVEALAHIAAQDGADRWVRAAVLSGIENRIPEFLTAFRKQETVKPEALEAVMKDLGELLGNAGRIADCRVLLDDVISAADNWGWRMSTALGLAEGISGRKDIKLSDSGPLSALQATSRSGQPGLDVFMSKVARLAADDQTPLHLRVTAADLLGYTAFEKTGSVLGSLLDARHPSELQITAVAALARQGDVRGGAILTEKRAWTNYTPRVRSAVIAALLSKPIFIDAMFNAIEQRVIAPSDIPSAERQRLIENKNDLISARAKVLFRELESAGRMQVYEDYRNILVARANGALGKAVFSRACSACHTYAGMGGNVGPDLTGVKNQPADALLLHILVPNYEVYPAYQAISVQMSDGHSISGRLVAETENSLTLRTAFGTDESILRTKITSLTNTGRSLMPEGLEQSMTKDELAELIAYLRSGGDSE